MKYVIDRNDFKGYVITSMSDGEHSDYGGETLEELKIRDNNPNLEVVTSEELNVLIEKFIQDLCSAPFTEISEDRYWDMMECVPPARFGNNWFFVGEPYTFDVFTFCFKIGDRYFSGLRRISTPKDKLREEMNAFAQSLSKNENISSN